MQADFAPTVSLTLNTTDTLKPVNTSVFTGTDAFATAPVVTTSFYDLGSFGGTADCGLPCQVYEITIPAAGDYDFSANWDNNTDLGLYFLDAGLNYLADACDAHGNGATAKTEDCTVTFPAAGTYYLEMDNYGPFYSPPDPAPAWFSISFSL